MKGLAVLAGSVVWRGLLRRRPGAAELAEYCRKKGVLVEQLRRSGQKARTHGCIAGTPRPSDTQPAKA